MGDKEQQKYDDIATCSVIEVAHRDVFDNLSYVELAAQDERIKRAVNYMIGLTNDEPPFDYTDLAAIIGSEYLLDIAGVNAAIALYSERTIAKNE